MGQVQHKQESPPPRYSLFDVSDYKALADTAVTTIDRDATYLINWGEHLAVMRTRTCAEGTYLLNVAPSWRARVSQCDEVFISRNRVKKLRVIGLVMLFGFLP